MAFLFSKASVADAPAVFQLILERIRWMDAAGLHQWNDTGYLEAYPESYYAKQAERGRLYILKQSGAICGAAVLLTEDSRWPDRSEPALYIHNLVAACDAKGAGSALLQHAESLARSEGRAFLRLDCAADNADLNRYYESRGFVPAGVCTDGPYIGNRREKVLA